MFSKITFLKSVGSKEKNEACLSFLENIFTKSVHRGGVASENNNKVLLHLTENVRFFVEIDNLRVSTLSH